MRVFIYVLHISIYAKANIAKIIFQQVTFPAFAQVVVNGGPQVTWDKLILWSDGD